MSKYTAPGSPRLRTIVQTYINARSYPKPVRVETMVPLLTPKGRELLQRLPELLGEEQRVVEGEIPAPDSPWAMQREKMCEHLRQIIEHDPRLLSIDVVQQQAIEKGAIPDPHQEDSNFRFYRLPDWSFAHWACGMPVQSKRVSHSVHAQHSVGLLAGTGEFHSERVMYCPQCELEPDCHGLPVRI